MVEIDVFVFQTSPQALDEHIVQSTSSSVHADLDVCLEEMLEKHLARELRSLIGVEDRRRPATERLGKHAGTEASVLGVGDVPSQDVATEPIDDRSAVHEAPLHRDVGDVRAPDMVRFGNRNVPEQVRVNRVIGRWIAQFWSWIDGLDAHQTHEPGNALVIDLEPVLTHRYRDPPHAKERTGGVLPVDRVHECERRTICRHGRVVQARTRQAQQVTLPEDGQALVLEIDAPTTRPQRQRQSFFFRKSRSTFRRPISSYSRAIVAS